MTNIEIKPIQQEVEQFLYEVSEINIASMDDYSRAGDIAKQAANKIKRLDEKRKEYTAPLDEAKKRIMADFNQVIKPLQDFVDALKQKMIVFYRDEQKRRDDEQKRIEQEALQKATENKQSEVVVPVVNDIKTQRGDVATTTVKKIWTFEVVDPAIVPVTYMTIDARKINDAIRDGVREINGIRIYQTESLNLR